MRVERPTVPPLPQAITVLPDEPGCNGRQLPLPLLSLKYPLKMQARNETGAAAPSLAGYRRIPPVDVAELA